MATIVGGEAWVNTATGVDDTSHGEASGTPCATLLYLMTSRVGTLTSDLLVHCAGATAEALTAASISGHSTATHKLTIKGDRWTSTTNGLYSTSYYHLTQAADNHMLTITELNMELDGIQFDMINAGSGNMCLSIGAAAAIQQVTIKNCWLRKSAGGGGNYAITGTVFADASSNFIIENSIISGYTSAGDRGINATDYYVKVYNCTFHDCTVGIYGPADTVIVKNCIFDSCDAEATGAWEDTSDYNSSTLDTTWDPVGSNNHDPCTDFNFADLANHDFRPTATSGQTNLRKTGVAIAGCTPDPLGTVRPSEGTGITRGAFEYIVPGGAASIVPIMVEEQVRRRQ